MVVLLATRMHSLTFICRGPRSVVLLLFMCMPMMQFGSELVVVGSGAGVGVVGRLAGPGGSLVGLVGSACWITAVAELYLPWLSAICGFRWLGLVGALLGPLSLLWLVYWWSIFR